MRPFKTVYLVFHDNKIIFPKSVRFFEDNLFICKSISGTAFIVSEQQLVRFSQKEFDALVKKIHKAIYNCEVESFDVHQIYDDGDIYTLRIDPNGMISCGNYCATVYVPPLCLKWDNVLLKSFGDNSYVLMPCDEKGRVLEHKMKTINPDSENNKVVYTAIKENPGISTPELIDVLGWSSNRVTSRLSELTSCGRVASVGHMLNPESGRNVRKWEIVK